MSSITTSIFKVTAEIQSFGGKLVKLQHKSDETKTDMDVNVYLPAQFFANGAKGKSLPVLLYLSGLTCTPNNASEKAFWQPYANKYGFAVVFPDTSPRGLNIEGEHDSYDFGSGAGFYVDATTEKWKDNYRMYSYVNSELLPKLQADFPILNFDNISITGHSMGGYGALQLFLRNPGKFKSVSAFSPISNPTKAPWGEKCFSGYLGQDKSTWTQYDPTELIGKYQGPSDSSILIHVGKSDSFYFKDHQLLPENFLKASENSVFKGKVDLNLVDGYDHSYYFISSFTDVHAAHHAKYLGLN
ncbi:intracellular esterase [Komagataella phaffii CBS 7435]|uniref:S-formylglutathione hydrolase n=3 Tax=Komagataella TaxID=460517 RepID=C4R5T5_KOMPG|nr:Non-essential intracellular esterase that can function as an S-formylglutathione hydrolase [Komagataella phaffii GS115]AOA63753.1 GQ67_03982T0 [Komagataella phaffii]CAH2449268.1 intracellular esterase [Komagataella phaffii CBS 7435]BAH57504.1 S-formylglutathione hydrolase [Komagataella pastoris]AOA68408.1 GQ68_03955T0 [Komagataella phaffii GS115]CAY70921.1 Non-essential intracellular esterase that can function as an S-formylglutathione hydrolase [Komagataella phaffii GS115]